MKKIGSLFFLLPFVISALNIQAFVTKFVSVNYGQIIAYLNVLLVILGIFISLKEIKPFPKTIKLWFAFFLIYYAFGLFGNFIHNTEAPLLKTTIPIIYFLGFSIFLNSKFNHNLFFKISIMVFTIANLFLIYFHKINFSLDYDGIYKYNLDRAGGIYGDANNAAVVCLLSFVFLIYLYKPLNKFQKILKFSGIIISLYALVLTFSITGFIILLIILGLRFRYALNTKRIFLLIIVLPFFSYFTIHTALNSQILSIVQKNRIERVVNILTLNTDKVTYSGRDVLLQNMMNYIYESPFIGNGIYFSTIIRGHNTILGIWADAGIVSFILFLYILFIYFKKTILADQQLKYFILSVLIVLTIFMLSLQTIINQPYLLVLFPFLSYLLEKEQFQDLNINHKI